MTLVVSEASRHGIVMLGDSAVTYSRGEEIIGVKPGAVKVQYSPELNIGISMWGWGMAGEQSLDKWIADFLKSQANLRPSLEQLGISLAQQINDFEKPLRLVATDRRRWLVHQDQEGITTNGLGNFNHLPGGDGKVQNGLSRIDIQCQLVQDSRRIPVQRLPVQKPQAVRRKVA